MLCQQCTVSDWQSKWYIMNAYTEVNECVTKAHIACLSISDLMAYNQKLNMMHPSISWGLSSDMIPSGIPHLLKTPLKR